MAGQWFGTQTDIISKQRSFFRGKKYTTTIKNVNSTLQALEDVFLDFAQILEVGAAALGGNAEGFLEGFSSSLTLDLKRMDSSQVQNALTDFLNDTILRAISEFLKDVEGLEPHVHAVLQSFSTDIESFVLALDFLTGLQNLFDIDLLDEATKAIEESQMGIIESYQNALAGYREIIAGYDGSIESLELLTNATAVMIQVQLDLIVVYQQVGLAISNMFQDSAQTILESQLSDEELFNFRQDRINELIEEASMTTDPEQLQSIADDENFLTWKEKEEVSLALFKLKPAGTSLKSVLGKISNLKIVWETLEETRKIYYFTPDAIYTLEASKKYIESKKTSSDLYSFSYSYLSYREPARPESILSQDP